MTLVVNLIRLFPRSLLRVPFFVIGLFSLFMFPWPVTAAITFISALWTPFLPVTLGILTDALYLAPYTSPFPLYTCIGAFLTIFAFVVRIHLKTSIIEV